MPTRPLDIRNILGRYGSQAAVYAILTGTLGSSKVQPEVGDRYIRELVERSVLLNAANRVEMQSDTRNIDRLTHSGRVLVFPGENTAPSLAGAISFGQRQLVVNEAVAAEDWSFQTIEDNIEGAALEDTLIAVMSQLASRDMEELVLYANADDVASPAFPDSGQNGDAFRQNLGGGSQHDGLLLLSNNMIDKSGAQPATVQAIFREMLDTIPSKILDSRPRMDWRFYVNSKLDRRFRESIGERGTNLGDRALFENIPVAYDGIPVEVVPMLLNETRDFGAGDITEVTDVLLMVPGNLWVGFRRDVEMDLERQPRERRFELTISTRFDANVEDPDAYVSMINVKTPA